MRAHPGTGQEELSSGGHGGNLGLPSSQREGRACPRVSPASGETDDNGHRVSTHTQPELARQPPASREHEPIHTLD